ncbi:MAG TPA: TlpA family protein disulfide reductase [Campylobacterales bacterium]|nr:TlpA family protein disulfide reductase [Campylobacterales bacterium]HIP41384.1 TlpA family protein disulfide reductase [Campylobacterales bacterium]
MKKIILAILLTLGVTSFLQAEETKAITFNLIDTDGKTVHVTETEAGLDFKEYKGKVVFLVLFGHICPPCNAEIPEFIELTEKYKDKLAIVALEAQRYSMSDLKAFKTKKNINYSLIPGKNHDDFISYIADRAQWNGSIPFLIAIDKNGAVQTVQPGFIPKATLEELIEKLTK